MMPPVYGKGMHAFNRKRDSWQLDKDEVDGKGIRSFNRKRDSWQLDKDEVYGKGMRSFNRKSPLAHPLIDVVHTCDAPVSEPPNPSAR